MQVADARALRARDAAAVRRNDLGDNAQQGRFARAVESDEPDPAVVRHGPAGAVEDGAPTEMFGDFVERQHCDSWRTSGTRAAIAPFKPLIVAGQGLRRKPPEAAAPQNASTQLCPNARIDSTANDRSTGGGNHNGRVK